MVHARDGGHRFEPRSRHVDDEGPSVGRTALEIEELVQSFAAALTESLEEYTEYLGRDLGVGQRAVAAEAGDAERGRPGIDRAAAALGRGPPPQAGRAGPRG